MNKIEDEKIMNKIEDEKIVEKLEAATLNFLLKDNDSIHYYTKKYNITKNIYIDIVKEVVSYCFNSEFNPFLDNQYLDLSYLIIDDYIINLDDIDEVLNEYLKDYKEELNNA